MKLDLLVLCAHPDDAELGCAGTLASHVAMGRKVGVIDLTRGELGTRGTPETRAEEAKAASAIMKLTLRDNLSLEDGFFRNDQAAQLRVIQAIRTHQPEIVITNATHDRHTDHGKGAQLVVDSSFLSGLAKIETRGSDGKPQQAWRPKAVYHFIQSQFIEPDFIVDITPYWQVKMDAIKAYRTQFYDPTSSEPETYISKPGFMKMIESRAIEFGHAIGVEYGEGFTLNRYPGVRDLFHLL